MGATWSLDYGSLVEGHPQHFSSKPHLTSCLFEAALVMATLLAVLGILSITTGSAPRIPSSPTALFLLVHQDHDHVIRASAHHMRENPGFHDRISQGCINKAVDHLDKSDSAPFKVPGLYP